MCVCGGGSRVAAKRPHGVRGGGPANRPRRSLDETGQTATKLVKSSQTGQTATTLVKQGPNWSNSDETDQTATKLVKQRPNWSKSDQTAQKQPNCQTAAREVKQRPNWSNSGQTGQTGQISPVEQRPDLPLGCPVYIGAFPAVPRPPVRIATACCNRFRPGRR